MSLMIASCNGHTELTALLGGSRVGLCDRVASLLLL